MAAFPEYQDPDDYLNYDESEGSDAGGANTPGASNAFPAYQVPDDFLRYTDDDDEPTSDVDVQAANTGAVSGAIPPHLPPRGVVEGGGPSGLRVSQHGRRVSRDQT